MTDRLPFVPLVTPRDLPTPAVHHQVWPWTVPTSRLPAPQAASLPTITVVTPSLGQAPFLEEAIRSVLLQAYPALQYVVLDGGSQDGSLEILERYSPWLSYWRSHADGGQAAAVQEGWDRGTGEIVAFLNADDVYLPGALISVAHAFSRNENAAAVCGRQLRISRDSHINRVERSHSCTLSELLEVRSLPQPAVFLRRSALRVAGGIQTRYPLIFDYDLWLRIATGNAIVSIPDFIAATREHAGRISERSRLDIAAELERYAVSGSQSLSLSERDRARLIANLHYVIACIYADAPHRHWRRAAAAALRGSATHPVVFRRVAQALLRRVGSSAAAPPDGSVAGLPLNELVTATLRQEQACPQ